MIKNISPHVNIYKFPIAAISSITNRITGFYLSGLFVTGGIVSLLNKEDFINNKYKTLDQKYKSIINYSVIFPVSYHTLGGIRHFMWDKYPKLLNNKAVSRSSFWLFGLSIGSTFLIENYSLLNKVRTNESLEILSDIFI